MCKVKNDITHVFLSNWSHPDMSAADPHGIKMAVGQKPPFPGSACPTWKKRAQRHWNPSSWEHYALFSLHTSTSLVCWSSRLMWPDPFGFSSRREAAILSYNVNVYWLSATAPTRIRLSRAFLFPALRVKIGWGRREMESSFDIPVHGKPS